MSRAVGKILAGLAAAAFATVGASKSVTPNVLIVYAPDASGQLKQMASAVEVGAKSAGANTRLMLAFYANYKHDVYEWADAVIMGSAVKNGQPDVSLLQFVNSFDSKDDFSAKVGGAFAIGKAVAGGVSEVLDELNRGLQSFGVLTTGGSSWKNRRGTAAVSTASHLLDSNGEEIRLAKDEGQKIASLAAQIKGSSLAPKVPTFPLAWKATTHGNLTQPGFFAGDVLLNFAVDCTEGPAKQKTFTSYPDGYTVITRCDKGYQYIIQPASRGVTCSLMDLKPESCTQCGCPYCIQTTAKKWPEEVQWEHVGDAYTKTFSYLDDNGRTFTELTRIWHGKQIAGDGSQKLSLEFATSVHDDKPVSMVVNSSEWISSSTWFENFTAAVHASDFDPAAGVTCPPPPPVSTKAHSSFPGPDRSRVVADARSSSTPVIPPSFPPKFKTSLLVNISQAGYDGGNVFINFTQDCSNGAAKQISHTTFGNFHNVLLNCSSGLVRSWDQPPGVPEPFNCQVQGRLGQDFPRNVCDVCGLPFSVASTSGKYTTSGKPSEIFQWERSGDSYSGVETTDALVLKMQVQSINGSIPQGGGTETPEQFLNPGSIANAYGQTIDQVGWMRTLVHLSPISTDVTKEDFNWQHFPCFNSDATPLVDSSPTLV